MNAPSSRHTAEGCWVHFPVFNRIPKKTYYGVPGLLHARIDGTKIIDSHFGDFVAMEENHLNKEMLKFVIFGEYLTLRTSLAFRKSSSCKRLTAEASAKR